METTNQGPLTNPLLTGFGFILALAYLAIVVALITWGIRLIRKDSLFWGILVLVIGASGLFGSVYATRQQY